MRGLSGANLRRELSKAQFREGTDSLVLLVSTAAATAAVVKLMTNSLDQSEDLADRAILYVSRAVSGTIGGAFSLFCLKEMTTKYMYSFINFINQKEYKNK